MSETIFINSYKNRNDVTISRELIHLHYKKMKTVKLYFLYGTVYWCKNYLWVINTAIEKLEGALRTPIIN